MILELFLWSRANKQRRRIEELEARLERLDPTPPPNPFAPPPVPRNDGATAILIVVCVLIIIAGLVLAGQAAKPAGPPLPTPRPAPAVQP